jgi:hypothetical protein
MFLSDDYSFSCSFCVGYFSDVRSVSERYLFNTVNRSNILLCNRHMLEYKISYRWFGYSDINPVHILNRRTLNGKGLPSGLFPSSREEEIVGVSQNGL